MLDRIQHHVENRDDGRFYVIEGKEYELESVTTNLRVINSPELNDWRVKHGRELSNQMRDEGGAIGTMVHDAGLRLFNGEGYGSFEWSLMGFPTPADERVRTATVGLELLRREKNLSQGDAELFVWSEKYMIGGTLDKVQIYKQGDGLVADILDWKTSDRIYFKAWLQLAAYATCFTECYGIPVRRIIPVRLERGPRVLPIVDGKPVRKPRYELGDVITVDGVKVARQYKEGPEITAAFDAFMHALELGRYIKSEGGRY